MNAGVAGITPPLTAKGTSNAPPAWKLPAPVAASAGIWTSTTKWYCGPASTVARVAGVPAASVKVTAIPVCGSPR